jgi:STE24 endopeptidase
METWTLVFLAAVAAGFATQWWLSTRQLAHVRAHADSVPAEFADRIALDDHRKAAAYNIARLGVGRWDLVLSTVLLLGWTLGGGLQLVSSSVATLPIPVLWQGVVTILAIMLIGGLIELPLSIWNTFVVEQRFGFNRNTPAGFVRDKLLGAALALLLGAPLIAAILWLMGSAGDYWWLWAWLIWTGFTLFVSWAYPVLIAPLFNKFEPLSNVALRQRLEALLTRCGFRSNGMFVMDGSRRSAHGNAYFTGFGANKRIVFFDTLLDGLDDNEVEAVLAHELGHFKRRHVAKGLVLSSLLSLAGLALLGWLAGEAWFYTGLGVAEPNHAVALLLFLLLLPVISIFVSPLFSALSRRHEYEADAFAAEQTDARHLISGLVKMYRDNASTLTPDPIYSAFYHSHPPASLRVAHLATQSG